MELVFFLCCIVFAFMQSSDVKANRLLYEINLHLSLCEIHHCSFERLGASVDMMSVYVTFEQCVRLLLY